MGMFTLRAEWTLPDDGRVSGWEQEFDGGLTVPDNIHVLAVSVCEGYFNLDVATVVGMERNDRAEYAKPIVGIAIAKWGDWDGTWRWSDNPDNWERMDREFRREFWPRQVEAGLKFEDRAGDPFLEMLIDRYRLGELVGDFDTTGEPASADAIIEFARKIALG